MLLLKSSKIILGELTHILNKPLVELTLFLVKISYLYGFILTH